MRANQIIQGDAAEKRLARLNAYLERKKTLREGLGHAKDPERLTIKELFGLHNTWSEIQRWREAMARDTKDEPLPLEG